jgi:hypothetical protein
VTRMARPASMERSGLTGIPPSSTLCVQLGVTHETNGSGVTQRWGRYFKVGNYKRTEGEDFMRVLAMSALVCALVPGLSAMAEAQSSLKNLRRCLEFKDMTMPRLICYDAIVPPRTKPKPGPAKVVNDCRFLKEDDERLIHDAVMALRRTNGVTAQTSMRRCVMVSNLARWVLPELRTIRRSEGEATHFHDAD